ncbi:MAG: abscisic acid-deficient protein Aba4 family protein [Planctomycetota bacterium]
MAETFFQATNTLALVAWMVLLLFPGKKLVSCVLCAVFVPGLLVLAYAAVIGRKLASNGPPPGDLMTLAGGHPPWLPSDRAELASGERGHLPSLRRLPAPGPSTAPRSAAILLPSPWRQDARGRGSHPC